MFTVMRYCFPRAYYDFYRIFYLLKYSLGPEKEQNAHTLRKVNLVDILIGQIAFVVF